MFEVVKEQAGVELSQAATTTVRYAVGIGLTNECDLSCAHCYRDTVSFNRLNLQEVQKICNSVNTGSINLGVGENGLHPQYHEILAWLHSQSIRTAVTSNGYSIEVLSDEELGRLHSVEFSIDFPTEAEQDGWRAVGNWQKCWEGVARCQRLGVPAAIMAVMMTSNYNRLGELAEVTATRDTDLRFNIYQPVTGDKFSLSYEQFWEGMLDVLRRTEVITVSEPLVNALLGFPRPTQGSPCGRTSLRVLPNGNVSPCTYWPATDRKLRDLYQQGEQILNAPSFERVRKVPKACQSCALVEQCGGGCASRRLLRGQPGLPDEFCPIVRNDQALLNALAQLKYKAAEFKDLPKAGNACTFVVRAR